jgi:hypothetical protein
VKKIYFENVLRIKYFVTVITQENAFTNKLRGAYSLFSLSSASSESADYEERTQRHKPL